MYKYLFFVVFISIILYSCSEVVEVEDHPKRTDGVLYIPVTPDSIIQKANDFVISSVGEDFLMPI